MEKYVLFMDRTGKVVKRDIVPLFYSPDLADEIYALVEQYGNVIQTLETVFGNLIMGFLRCNVMAEESRAQNDQALLPEYDMDVHALKRNTDKIIDSIRSVQEKLIEHCCLVNNLTDSAKKTEQTLGKPFPGIEKMKESKQTLQHYIIKCDDYIGILTVLNNELP